MLTQTVDYCLRDYQEELREQVFSQWAEGVRRVLAQLPTGAGKTVFFSAIADKFTRRGDGVLVLAHREELLLQAKEKLEIITGEPVGLIKAGYSASPDKLVQVASVQSLTRRSKFPEANLIIVDEAHHSAANSYTKILEHYCSAYILGVTATPARADGQGFNNIYDALILGRSVRELIETGYLSRFKLFASLNTINTTSVQTTGGDYNLRELAEAIDTSLVMGDLIESWRKYALQKKTVLFAIDITHSKAVVLAYQKAGISAEHLDGETPTDERKAILERFRTGQTLILSNCGIISEGFDVPAIECIQCVRPTKSLILWLQMVGRALRSAPGKDHAIIIDHTQNWFIHGLPDEAREWSLEPLSLKSGRLTLECPTCQHVFVPLPHERKLFRTESHPNQSETKFLAQAKCPNCGEVVKFEITEGEALSDREINNDIDAEIKEINLEINPEVIKKILELRLIQQARKYKPVWIYHSLVSAHPNLGLGELRECAKLLGYQPGWAWHRWLELQRG